MVSRFVIVIRIPLHNCVGVVSISIQLIVSQKKTYKLCMINLTAHAIYHVDIHIYETGRIREHNLYTQKEARFRKIGSPTQRHATHTKARKAGFLYSTFNESHLKCREEGLQCMSESHTLYVYIPHFV